MWVHSSAAASIEPIKMATDSSFTALPDDVLQRVLVGRALTITRYSRCLPFAGDSWPAVPALAPEYGFAERSMILVGS